MCPCHSLLVPNSPTPPAGRCRGGQTDSFSAWPRQQLQGSCHIARHGSVLSETKKWTAITHRTGFSSSPGLPATFMAVCGVRHEGSHCSSLFRPVTTAACPRWTLTQDVNFDLNFGTIILICIANASDLCINVSVTVSARQLLQIGNFKQVIAKPGDILDLTSFINVFQIIPSYNILYNLIAEVQPCWASSGHLVALSARLG